MAGVKKEGRRKFTAACITTPGTDGPHPPPPPPPPSPDSAHLHHHHCSALYTGLATHAPPHARLRRENRRAGIPPPTTAHTHTPTTHHTTHTHPSAQHAFGHAGSGGSAFLLLPATLCTCPHTTRTAAATLLPRLYASLCGRASHYNTPPPGGCPPFRRWFPRLRRNGSSTGLPGSAMPPLDLRPPSSYSYGLGILPTSNICEGSGNHLSVLFWRQTWFPRRPRGNAACSPFRTNTATAAMLTRFSPAATWPAS